MAVTAIVLNKDYEARQPALEVSSLLSQYPQLGPQLDALNTNGDRYIDMRDFDEPNNEWKWQAFQHSVVQAFVDASVIPADRSSGMLRLLSIAGETSHVHSKVTTSWFFNHIIPFFFSSELEFRSDYYIGDVHPLLTSFPLTAGEQHSRAGDYAVQPELPFYAFSRSVHLMVWNLATGQQKEDVRLTDLRCGAQGSNGLVYNSNDIPSALRPLVQDVVQQYNEVRNRLSRYSQVECEGGEEIGECPSDDEYAIFPMTPITEGERTQELDAGQDCGGGCGGVVDSTDYDLE